MSKRMLVVGLVLVISILVVGVVALWALPGQAEAYRGGGRGCTDCGTDLSEEAPAGVGGGYRGGRGAADSGMPGGRSAGGVPGCAGQTDTCEACSDNPVVGSLSEVETSALRAALEDEYRARALYEQALADLNSVRPLANIKRAEERHIAMLENMFTRYGLEIPPVQEGGQDGTFATLAHACAAGVTAETTNVALYDQLLPQLDNPDLIRVFTALQRASETRHLPALEACAP